MGCPQFVTEIAYTGLVNKANFPCFQVIHCTDQNNLALVNQFLEDRTLFLDHIHLKLDIFVSDGFNKIVIFGILLTFGPILADVMTALRLRP